MSSYNCLKTSTERRLDKLQREIKEMINGNVKNFKEIFPEIIGKCDSFVRGKQETPIPERINAIGILFEQNIIAVCTKKTIQYHWIAEKFNLFNISIIKLWAYREWSEVQLPFTDWIVELFVEFKIIYSVFDSWWLFEWNKEVNFGFLIWSFYESNCEKMRGRKKSTIKKNSVIKKEVHMLEQTKIEIQHNMFEDDM